MYHIDAIMKLLSLQEGMQVVEQSTQVRLPVPVGDHDGRVVAGLTVGGTVSPPREHQGVSLTNLIQGQRGR